MPDDRLTAAAERVYAVWFRHTYPLAVHPASYSWQLLEPQVRVLWECMVQAALAPRNGPLSAPTLATLQARLDALCAFVGYDQSSHAPLDEIVTLEDRLRTIDTAVELMHGQLGEILALLKGGRHA
jgi:hypothetical protein